MSEAMKAVPGTSDTAICGSTTQEYPFILPAQGGPMSRSLYFVFCSTLFSFIPLAAVQAQPDFTGVWRLASQPMTSAQGYPEVPLTAEAQIKVDAYRALVDPVGDNPTLWCVTHGMPEIMMGGGSYPLEFIQKPDQITIINEWMSETRRIDLGNRYAADAAIFPTRQGYSRGRWEGDVLVVETTHLQEMVDSRFPHSANTTITERFSLTQDADGTPRLIADTIVHDPQWLARPLEYRLEWTPSPFNWILPFECMEETWLDRLDELAEQAGQSD
jgi:hypothetical protein